MSHGRQFGIDLPAGVNTTLTNPVGLTLTLNVSFCNRTDSSASVRLALATSASPGLGDWLEWDAAIAPKGVLERTAIVVGAGEFLVARAAAAGVSCVGFGFEKTT